MWSAHMAPRQRYWVASVLAPIGLVVRQIFLEVSVSVFCIALVVGSAGTSY